jgi:flavodoxin
MRSLVVYESRYGNTARIAREIATGLEADGPVRLVEASDPGAFEVAEVDLLVVGGPTEGHGVSQTLRARLSRVPPGGLDGVAAAAFDTRVTWPAFLAGSAAKGLGKTLRRLGARVVAPPESFLVSGGKANSLIEGEPARAAMWAARLCSVATAAVPAPR